HPSTANFIATKLSRRFVNDTPPTSVVDAAAAAFTPTAGALREWLRTILTAPESAAPADAKAKRPFELVPAAIRAVGATVTPGVGTKSLYTSLHNLAQSPFAWQVPH